MDEAEVSRIVERAIAEDAHKHPEDLAAVLEAVTRERDEARNEAKRWSGHNRHSKEVIVRQSRRIEALTRQRDEAHRLWVRVLEMDTTGETVRDWPELADFTRALSPERTAELISHTSLTGAELAGGTRTLTDDSATAINGSEKTGTAADAGGEDSDVEHSRYSGSKAVNPQEASRASVNSILGATSIAGAGNAAPDTARPGFKPGDAPPPLPLWQIEPCKPEDLYTWIYRETKAGKEYLAGSTGRIKIELAREVLPLLNTGAVASAEKSAPLDRGLRPGDAPPPDAQSCMRLIPESDLVDTAYTFGNAPSPATCNVEFATLPAAIRCQLPLNHPRPVREDGVPCHAGQDAEGRIVVFGEGQACVVCNGTEVCRGGTPCPVCRGEE